MHVDHIGIAVEDVDAFTELYASLFDLQVAHEEEFDGLSVAFLDADGVYLEILEPLEDGTAIGDFLDRNGPGMHHVAFTVEDIENALENARAAGAALIDDVPRPGAWGHTVAFLHPKSMGGVLVEFVEH
ncbi:Lactoylglutathione lyase or related enzyme [Halanaeroarchaeum sp. HSR-CO]|uniref:methylmalonyl-CoA epimerase n=1 Tax=Halanaeroarchaeum sp. HSR-CO TaxID=2866382 RepID=UPI00217F000F|nr:methylmalonyl-CoA epimerase [Halanaeroarchaeum sp. HSR-CO]UWG47387.1 Lactoylglutathione lyase or related enzyme [Halanaeroarchaeum sp. HSR-CO]